MTAAGYCHCIPDEAETTPEPITNEAPVEKEPEQALHVAEALAQGRPGRMKIISTVLRGKVRELV